MQPDGPTREQIFAQLLNMTQQESAQMQFMLDISRSMSKAYTDLVFNFLSSLTNLVLLRRDAYLHHAHPNFDALSSQSTQVSGGDLFERSLMPALDRSRGETWIQQHSHPYPSAPATVPFFQTPLLQRRIWRSQGSWLRRQHKWYEACN